MHDREEPGINAGGDAPGGCRRIAPRFVPVPYPASPALIDFVQRLPKTETHLHLDGAVPYDLLQEFDPVKFSRPPPFWAHDFRYKSFAHFMDEFSYYIDGFFTSAERFHDTARRVFANCAEQNCRYVETSFNLSLLLAVKESGREILRAIRTAAPPGMEIRIFGGMCHDHYRGALREIIDEALTWPELAGIDLHGPEDRPLEDWTAGLWEQARRRGKYTKAHAGEFMGADFVDRILNELRPERIEHGVRAGENPATVARLVRQNMALDVCVLSNVKLAVQGVPSVAAHPIRQLFDAGITVTVNSDDPLLFGNSLSEEYYALHRELNFTLGELVQVAGNGFRVALLPESTRKAFLDDLEKIRGEVDENLKL
jgi:adenosine deaminase